MNAVSIKNLRVGYQQNPVLKNVNLEFPAGQLTAIIGPNGAGKSTLIKSIMRLLPHKADEVLFFGQDLTKNPLAISYVPQREEVDWSFPISVLEVVLMGRQGHLKFWQRPSLDDKKLALFCLDQVGMKEFCNRQISELSGGQQQRVFIARALVQQAELYLMDEPFAGVDIATEKAIIDIFKQLKTAGKTVVCVHHDLNTLRDYFDYVAIISKDLVVAGTVDEVLTLENLDLAFEGRLPSLDKLAGKSVIGGE